MRLDHLLSKDWICVGWLPGRLILLRLLNGSGPAGGLLSRKAGRSTVVHWCAGWLACLVLGVGNTPAVVGCCGLVVVVVCWWWVPLRVWGWHAVGVLGQCALVA